MFGKKKEKNNSTEQAVKEAKRKEKKGLKKKFTNPQTEDEALYNKVFFGTTKANIVHPNQGEEVIIYDKVFNWARVRRPGFPGYYLSILLNEATYVNTKEIVGKQREFKGNTKQGSAVGVVVELKYKVVDSITAWREYDNVFSEISTDLDNLFTQMMSHRTFEELKNMDLIDLNCERRRINYRLQQGEVDAYDAGMQLDDLDRLQQLYTKFETEYGVKTIVSAKIGITGAIAKKYEDIEEAKTDQEEAKIRIQTEKHVADQRNEIEKKRRQAYLEGIALGGQQLYRIYTEEMGMDEAQARALVSEAIKYEIATSSGRAFTVLGDENGSFTTAVAAQGAVKSLGTTPQA